MNAVTARETAAAMAASQRPFAYPIGIEFTMMPKVCSGAKTNESSDSSIAQHYADILELMLQRRRVKFHNCHRDGRAVEAPSPILVGYEDAKKSYEGICGAMTDIGLVPGVSGVISGGNHMHVGPMPTRTMVNLFRDIQNRPYLLWAFNDPDDGMTANTFTEAFAEMTDQTREQALALCNSGIDIAHLVSADSLTDEAKNVMTFYGKVGKKFDPDWLPDDKRHCLRYASGQKTLEFRFLDVPISWQECEAQLMFVDAYVRWVEIAYKDKMCEVIIDSKDKLVAITQEQAVASFKEFIGTTLGLPLERYDVWLSENIPLKYERNNRK